MGMPERIWAWRTDLRRPYWSLSPRGMNDDTEYIRADVAKAERDELLEALKVACDLIEDIDNDTSDHAVQRCDAVIPKLKAAIGDN